MAWRGRGAFACAAIALFTGTQCGVADDTSSAANGASDAGISEAASDGAIASQGDSAIDTGEACSTDAVVSTIASCIDGGGGPLACLAAARGVVADPCDGDSDGMDDALEDAMMRSYAPAFAYNLGDGGHTAGSTEPNWPVNAAFYVANSSLIWRVDDNASSVVTIDSAPTLSSLPLATFMGHAATSPVLGDGPNFWLCLNQPGGSYSDASLVSTVEASRTLSGGIDLFASVHPSGSDVKGHYAVIGYMLYYTYNSFSLDNHEGDWEGGAVFVNLDSGNVAALDTERHATADTEKLIPLEGTDALPAKDPTSEAPHYDVCDPTDTSDIGGVRFWDFSGEKHHAVIYAAAGSHASYGYPGATKIQGVGCSEATMVRDVHNGNAEKLVPFDETGAYYLGWSSTNRSSRAACIS